MAIIHQASISPTKAELLEAFLGQPSTTLGAYRFDDPAGEVGIEGFVVRVGEALQHVALTYRGAPLDDDDVALVSTMEHSVLGTRWIYEASTDPVALSAFARALAGEQEQADEEVWNGQQHVTTRDPSVRITREEDDAWSVDAAPVLIADLDAPVATDAAARLVATWDGGSATVAYVPR